MSPQKFMQSETQRKNIHALQSVQPLCTSIKKWSKRSKADYNLRSGPILAVLIYIFSYEVSFRFAQLAGQDRYYQGHTEHREKISVLATNCTLQQAHPVLLYLLLHPPDSTLTYLLTYLPILTYLCYSLCPSVCFFVFFLFLKRSGLVLRSCPVSLSPFDFHIESSKCCDP